MSGKMHNNKNGGKIMLYRAKSEDSASSPAGETAATKMEEK